MSYKPDIGTLISLDSGINITGATVTVEVKKPSGALASWPATLNVDNQHIEHIVSSGDLTEVGTYILQAKVVIGIDVWYGNSTQFLVRDLFN